MRQTRRKAVAVKATNREEQGKWILVVNVRAFERRGVGAIKWEDLISVFVSNLIEEAAMNYLWSSFSYLGRRVTYSSKPQAGGVGVCGVFALPL